MPEMWRCPKCNKVKDVTQFSKWRTILEQKEHSMVHICKDCHCASQKAKNAIRRTAPVNYKEVR